MIDVKRTKRYCREDITKIENYDKAITDMSQTWDCHHRDEIRTLPSSMTVIRSSQDLKEAGRYFNCPANELIFLTKSEHQRLHNTGKTHSDETRRKKSESKKGEKNSFYGKKHSDETKKKMSEARKTYWTKRKVGL